MLQFACPFRPALIVLIAPFWYWNENCFHEEEKLVNRFNRTFLVLKFTDREQQLDIIERFNRTFLVLKFRCFRLSGHVQRRFNRTFLVLKSRRRAYACKRADRVLIAPFWYWNSGQGSPILHQRLAGFNRTFLVLKLNANPEFGKARLVLIAPFWYWNGVRRDACLAGWPLVLIAPFWYWNNKRRHSHDGRTSVLIAPFWYWNTGDRSGHTFTKRF